MYTCTYDLKGVELGVSFTYTMGKPAVLYAPAEDCYPAEDAEACIEYVHSGNTLVDIDDIYVGVGGDVIPLLHAITDYILDNIDELTEWGA
jgi:hypothetical protein